MKAKYFTSILIIELLLETLISCDIREKKFTEEGILVNGRVIEISILGGPGNFDSYSVTYNYIVNKKKYSSYRTITGISAGFKEALMYKLMPVIYLESNPKNSRLLISEYDFEKFSLEYPDSISIWTKENW